MKIFNRTVPAMVLALIVLAGLGSAGLLTYYGMIIGTVTVEQGLTIDGNAWNVPIEEQATIYSTQEKTITSANHQLRNAADNDVVVKLISTCTADKTDNSCEDTDTISLFELSIPAADANQVQDRVVAKSDAITVNAIDTLSFDYKLTVTTSGNSPYFVLGLDTNDDGVQDGWVISWQDKSMAADTWHTHGTDLTFHIVGSSDCTQSDPCNLAEVKDEVGTAKVLEVKAMLGYWGDTTATTALVKNIEVNGASLIDVNGIIVPDDSFTDENGHVDFSIETHFPQGMKPAIYTITTSVVPVTE